MPVFFLDVDFSFKIKAKSLISSVIIDNTNNQMHKRRADATHGVICNTNARQKYPLTKRKWKKSSKDEWVSRMDGKGGARSVGVAAGGDGWMGGGGGRVWA